MLNSTCDRRRFLRQAATIIAVGGAVPHRTEALSEGENPRNEAERAGSEGETSMIPIVDTHQHLWDLKRFRLPWLTEQPALSKSFLMSDYLKATDGLNVVKSVYMEVDVEPAQQVEEAEYIIDMCRHGGSPLV